MVSETVLAWLRRCWIPSLSVEWPILSGYGGLINNANSRFWGKHSAEILILLLPCATVSPHNEPCLDHAFVMLTDSWKVILEVDAMTARPMLRNFSFIQ